MENSFQKIRDLLKSLMAFKGGCGNILHMNDSSIWNKFLNASLAYYRH